MKCERCMNNDPACFTDSHGKIVCTICKSVVEECCQGQQLPGGAPEAQCDQDDDVGN